MLILGLFVWSSAGFLAKAEPVLDLFEIKTIANPNKPKPKSKKDDTESLRILTWNIQMLPRWVIKKGQNTRAAWIIDTLLQQDVDIIVFEEVFDIGIRGRLRLALLPKYPFQVGVQNKGC